jgi:hypothetical protein
MSRAIITLACLPWALGVAGTAGTADGARPLPVVSVEGQPLAAVVQRVVEALDHLGAPLSAQTRGELAAAGEVRDARKLQELLDAHVLLVVHINPEARVKVARGPAPARLQQAG